MRFALLASCGDLRGSGAVLPEFGDWFCIMQRKSVQFAKLTILRQILAMIDLQIAFIAAEAGQRWKNVDHVHNHHE
jgi:hypothetical protein